MKQKKNILLTFLILICGLSSLGQTLQTNESEINNSDFFLSIRTYGHAELIIEGTLTYSLTNGILTISRRGMLSEEDKIIHTKEVEKNSIDKIRNIRIDNLKDDYYNNCVMITSGGEYYITAINKNVKKEIHLHHYYVKQIAMLINELNQQIPDDLKINYVSSNTKQNCK